MSFDWENGPQPACEVCGGYLRDHWRGRPCLKMTEPDRIARLPHDPRGYPIPWAVLRGDDGTPFFTINDDRKALEALRRSLCPICGDYLGRWRWFVGGPRSAFDPNGYYLDLPGHRECMEFALQTCPYLALPKYLGRIDIVHPEKLPREAHILLDETMNSDRPEIFVAVVSSCVEALDRGAMQPYLKPVAPFLDFTFWRHGRQINEWEAMPFLRAALGEEWQLPKKAA
jgi:hypothetical protein